MGFETMWIVLLVCAAACAVGFIKYVYFLSIGYGFAIAAGAAATAIVLRGSIDWIGLCQMLVLIAYGARLSGFLLVRELKSASYRKTLSDVTKTEKPMPLFVSAAIWVSVALLYTMQLSPMFYRLYNGVGDVWLPVTGMAISIAGLLLEAEADRQKSAQKAENPDMVATKQLYRIVRCPNYLGEVIFWTGVFVGGFGSLRGAGQWIMAALAWVLIVLIMMNGAQRLEKRQMKRYGSDPAYKAYADSTPIIFPFVPLYHLNKQQ